MVKYRRRVQIFADILKASEKSAKKTRIMYAANLNHRLLKKYLRQAVDIGFLNFNENGYEVTKRG